MTDPHVVGAGIIDFGELYEQSFDDLLESVSLSPIEGVDKGVDPGDINAAWYGTIDIASEGASGSAVAHATGLFERPITRIENVCATGSDAFQNAVQAVKAGDVEVALVIGTEKMTDSTEGVMWLTRFLPPLKGWASALLPL